MIPLSYRWYGLLLLPSWYDGSQRWFTAWRAVAFLVFRYSPSLELAIPANHGLRKWVRGLSLPATASANSAPLDQERA